MGLKTLWNKLRRKKEEKPKSPWVEQEPKSDTKTKSVRTFSLPSFPKIKKIRLGFLLTFKRILAAFCFLINLVSGFIAFPHIVSILLLTTSFILLDYLWKTKRQKIKWGTRP